MELSNFVAQTLEQIIDGVARAQEYAGKNGASVNPNSMNLRGELGRMLYDVNNGRVVQVVDFDVALTTSDGTKTRGGIGVVLGAIAVGTQGASESDQHSATRISFSVPVMLPEGGA